VLIHPQFDPVALSLGPLSVHWYGLMYLLAFLQFWWLGRHRILAIRSLVASRLDVRQLDDLLFYGVLGVIAGGRLGQVLFYEPGYYLAHPLQILAIWRGGMSFHGGLLGVLSRCGCTPARRPPLARNHRLHRAAGAARPRRRAHRQLHQRRIVGSCGGSVLALGNGFSPGSTICRATPRNSIRPGLEGLALFVVLWLYSPPAAAARRRFRRLSDRLRLPALERRVFSLAG
jgi:phosphatidylglycerol:prolipoprotein diacylglycerol transferase